MFGRRSRAVTACSKMVPKSSSQIRLLEFKIQNYALPELRILIYQHFPSQPTITGSLLGHGYLWNVTGMEMSSTQREQKWPQGRKGPGFQSWDLARDHPPGTFMYTFSSCFQLELCLILTSENDFRFSSLPRCAANVPSSTRKAAQSSVRKLVPRWGPIMQSSKIPLRLYNQNLPLGGQQGIRSVRG